MPVRASLSGQPHQLASSARKSPIEYPMRDTAPRSDSENPRHPPVCSSADEDDHRTLETLASHEVELTEAEQQRSGSGILEAAQRSGEEWPSPLIIEMARAMQGGESR